MIDSLLFKIIKNIWPSLAVFSGVLIIMRIFAIRNSTKSYSFYKEIFSVMFIIYLFILYDLISNIINIKVINYIPFMGMLGNSLSFYGLFHNILPVIVIFIPIGFFVSSYIKEKSLKEISIIALLINLIIYLVIFKTKHLFDMDYLLLSFIGIILGFLLFIGLSAIKKHLPGIFQNDFLYNILSIGIIIGLILYFLGIINIGWL